VSRLDLKYDQWLVLMGIYGVALLRSMHNCFDQAQIKIQDPISWTIVVFTTLSTITMSTQDSTETEPAIDLSRAAALNLGLLIESNSTAQNQRNGELDNGDDRMAIDGEEETNDSLNVLPIYADF
jgi:hypothetical protein